MCQRAACAALTINSLNTRRQGWIYLTNLTQLPLSEMAEPATRIEEDLTPGLFDRRNKRRRRRMAVLAMPAEG